MFVVGVCVLHPEISGNSHRSGRDEWADVDIFHQLLDWWTICGRVRARDEGEKLSRNPRNA